MRAKSSIEIGVRFTVSLWDAIKWRIAGKEIRDEIIRTMRESREKEDDK